MAFPFPQIRRLLIDLDGVMYRGNVALPHAHDFVHWLRERDIQYRLVTNNATLTPVQYVEKLRKMGIDVGEDEFFTSALATALYLREQGARGQAAFVIGEDGLVEALHEIGVRIHEGEVDWVVVGLDRHLTYDKLAGAALKIGAGARFVGTNPDRSFPSERGLVPGAGALLAALSATTGIEPMVIGKPEPLMLQLAMISLGSTIDDTAMLGDRLDTDIQGAGALHMPSILTLTGVSTKADLERSRIQPTLVVEDLSQLMREWS
ncbi:MAG: haloacid dehalogenase [Chloroflexi bacterium]|nr:MAG: haloacid dehalogenase [Chloroflexota bacterium]